MRFLLAVMLSAASLAAAEPPRGLVKEIAANGALFQKELSRYAYRQTFEFFELERGGTPRGSYREVRDILFTPSGERVEEFVKSPRDALQRMKLTEEDFRDIRDVQPFVLTNETAWLYELDYKGEEAAQGQPCWIFRIKPRQLLEGQRFFDGLLWVSQEHRQVVQASGQPVPQLFSTKGDNLFPHFTTVYQLVDGEYWFPVKTYAEDTLPFASGLQRVRYEISFENYQRFTAESKIDFGLPVPPDPRKLP